MRKSMARESEQSRDIENENPCSGRSDKTSEGEIKAEKNRHVVTGCGGSVSIGNTLVERDLYLPRIGLRESQQCC